MTTIIPVKFKYSLRELWFDPKKTGAQQADHVIVETERGTEIGLAVGDTTEVDDETLKATIGAAPLRNVLRIATDQDLARAEHLSKLGEEALPVFRKRVHESDLDMKPVGVEYLFGGEKVVCYFAAQDRVDFRQLVRDLSRDLHQHIDMRQIGVREEAALIGGYGHCGEELCCRRFVHEFQPVSIRMAKEQDLPLNSSKISGACGRLMCCLRYEFEAYRDFKSRAPKRNAVITTPLGKAKIAEYDTPKEELVLRFENGKSFRVALKDMTASPAAIKKVKEQGCPCRPDTVERSVLDRLESPDIQMALAELDRQHGVVPPKERGLAAEDDLLNGTTTVRRGRTASSRPSHMVRAEIPEGEEAPATPRPRRRKVHAERDVDNHGEATQQVQEKAAAHPRRRRHHVAEGAQKPNAVAHVRQGDRQKGQQNNKLERMRRDECRVALNARHLRDHGSNAETAQRSTSRRRRHTAASQAQQAKSQSQGNSADHRAHRRRHSFPQGNSGNSAGIGTQKR